MNSPDRIASVGITALLALFLPFAQPAMAATDTEAHWQFSTISGPVIDTDDLNGQLDSSDNRQNNGWVGYSPWGHDDGQVLRNGYLASFNGHPSSIVFIDPSHHADFNPGTGSLIINTRFKVDRSVLSDLALAPNETWNLIQKGRFYNTGGQWKVQIRKASQGGIFVHCLVNDNKADTPVQSVQAAIDPDWILGGHILEADCTLDRSAQELRVNLTNRALGISRNQVTSTLPTDFGSVAPIRGACGTPNAFGGNVTIGNKPMCSGEEYDVNDAFRGSVYKIRLLRY